MKNYYITTQEHSNPFYDKRCRYDFQSIEKIPANSPITEYVTELTIGGVTIPTYNYTINVTVERKNKSYTLPRDVFKTLSVTPYTLTPVDEFNMKYAEYRNEEMIREFLTRGLINIEDIHEYYNRPE
jgi:hypothetical protein